MIINTNGKRIELRDSIAECEWKWKNWMSDCAGKLRFKIKGADAPIL